MGSRPEPGCVERSSSERLRPGGDECVEKDGVLGPVLFVSTAAGDSPIGET